MAQFQAFDANVEVIGMTINGVIETMGLFERMAKNIYARYGIADVRDDGWYSQQAYLDVFREIFEKVGAKTVKLIGKTTPSKVLWPSEITTIEQGLASIDTAYRLNHRGGEIGSYGYQKTGDRSARMTCHNPYPCPFDEGLLEGVAGKFVPPQARVRVTHDDPQHCRLNGGETCIYTITW